MKLQLLKWNEERILVLPILPEKAKVIGKYQAEISKNKKRKHKKSILNLTYGINTIPEEYWLSIRNHKSIEAHLKEKRLEEVFEVAEKSGKKHKITKFSEMSFKESLIEQTYDIRTLERYLDEETQPNIRLLIQKRIDEINDAKIDETIGYPESHLNTTGRKRRKK